jgi:hypothetical protein
MTGEDADEISEESRRAAERVRERAAGMPDAAGLAGMTADVLAVTTTGGQMSPADMRRLAAEALVKAQEVSYLLGKLAGILGDRPGDT